MTYPSGSTAKIYYLQDGSEVTLRQMIAKEPEWARNRIIEGEKAIATLQEVAKNVYGSPANLIEWSKKVGEALLELGRLQQEKIRNEKI